MSATAPQAAPTTADEKRLRGLGEHEALHELERLCCVVARACCDIGSLDALTMAGFDTPETRWIMKFSEELMARASGAHEEKFPEPTA